MKSRGFTAVLKYWFKDLATSISSVTVFPPSNKEIFVVLTPLSERGLTVFQKSFLLVILFKSRLSLLQKFYCHLTSFKFSLDLVFKYLCCSSVLFIIAFLIGFVTYGVWLALIVLFLIGACLPKTLRKIFSKTCYHEMVGNS